jgi:hypothetical protein
VGRYRRAAEVIRRAWIGPGLLNLEEIPLDLLHRLGWIHPSVLMPAALVIAVECGLIRGGPDPAH